MIINNQLKTHEIKFTNFFLFHSFQTQLQLAYQEKEDENLRLKHYIDTILLNIVENYPQILEVKTNEVSSKR